MKLEVNGETSGAKTNERGLKETKDKGARAERASGEHQRAAAEPDGPRTEESEPEQTRGRGGRGK